MSTQIIAAQNEQFSANVEHLAQQMDSRFRGKVREADQKSKVQFFDQLGATEAVKRTTRHGDTPRVDSQHRRRQATLNDYDWSDLVDSLDEIKMLYSPTSKYAEAAAAALNRAEDREVIAASTGTAYADIDGSGTVQAVALPSTQKVAVDYITTGSPTNSGLTLAKLIKTKSILGKAELPAGSKFYFAYSQQQLDDLLLNVQQVSSSDYASVKALVNGEISYFVGFDFVKTELLALNTSTDVRTCFAWAKNCLLLTTGQAARGKISERNDKNHATQVYYNMCKGATRMQEVGVVEVACDQSP